MARRHQGGRAISAAGRRRSGGRSPPHAARARPPATGAAVPLAFPWPGRQRRVRVSAPRMSGIEAIISDFGGVLTSPLLDSFAAFQDSSGISLEELGTAMVQIAARRGANP